MADTKITALDAIAAIVGADLLAVVDDVAGTPKTTKGTITQLAAFLDGLTQTLTNKSIDLTNNTLTGTSAELATAISDETGSSLLVFNTSPTLVTPALGTPSALVGTNITGTGSSFTAGNVTTNANLTGPITSVGNATTIASGPVLTVPQINDTSSDHQYIFAVNELVADRTVTLPLLTGNDTFVFEAFAATLTNKVIDADNNTISNIALGAEATGASTDLTDTANIVLLAGSQTLTGTKTLNSFKGTGAVTVTNILDEDAMGTDSATMLATQQSIKAYVDSQTHETGIDDIVEDITPQIGGALDGQGFDLNNMGVLFLTEQAEAESNVAGKGQIWVDTASPNILKFTDDVDTDFTVANTAMKLDAFAATTSAELAGIISNETGSSLLVFNTSPTLITPVLGTPSSGNLGSCTVIPMAQASGILPDANMPNLTGDVTTVEGAVATSIADNVVDLAELTHQADGSLYTFSATTVPILLAPGTEGQVLTSHGAGAVLTYEDATGGISDVTGSALLDGRIWIGDVSNEAVELALSGDVTMTNAGVTTVANDSHTHVEANISDLGTAIALVADKLDVFAATTSLEFIGVISDETGTGLLVFNDSPVLITPALGTPSALVGTNITGTAAGLTAGNVTTNANLTGPITSVGNATTMSANAATFNTALSDNTFVFTDGIDLTQYPIPCTLEVSEGAIAFPDIHALATGGTKVSGWVLPDGAATSTINFKCVVPSNVTGTSQKIRVRCMTQTADSDHAVRLTVSTIGLAINEDMDVAPTAETEVTAEMPNATETMNEALIEVDLTATHAAGDTILGQLTRDPTDAVDDYAGDILIVGVDLLVDMTVA